MTNFINNPQILKVKTLYNISHQEKSRLHDLLVNDGVLLYPCDTCWALSCSIFSESAFEKIFTIKTRDTKKAVSIAFSDIQQLDKYIIIDHKTRQFLKQHTPERLTLILPVRPGAFPQHILTPDGYVGVRIPKDNLSRTLAASVGPIITTSANVSGEPPVYTWNEIEQFLRSIPVQPDMTVYRKQQPTNLPSTIISTVTMPWTVVRQGGFRMS